VRQFAISSAVIDYQFRPMTERPVVLSPNSQGEHLGDWSYRVSKKDETEWHWELCDPDGQVVARGVAETRAKAAAHAMIAGLEIVGTQRSSEDDNTGGVHD
jgi:hypothetical protein